MLHEELLRTGTVPLLQVAITSRRYYKQVDVHHAEANVLLHETSFDTMPLLD